MALRGYFLTHPLAPLLARAKSSSLQVTAIAIRFALPIFSGRIQQPAYRLRVDYSRKCTDTRCRTASLLKNYRQKNSVHCSSCHLWLEYKPVEAIANIGKNQGPINIFAIFDLNW